MRNFLLILTFLTLSFNIFAQDFNDTTKAKNSNASTDYFSDTTSLKVSTYQFNKYNTIDTIGIDTAQRHIELFDKYSHSLIPVINLGQLATPTLYTVFMERNDFDDFMFLSPYNDFLFLPENSSYLNTNRPYTKLSFMFGPKEREEQELEATHSQSKGDTINFGINFKLMTALNPLTSKDNSSITNLKAWYYRDFKRYKIFATIYSNKVKRIEYGGIVDTNGIDFTTDNIIYYFSKSPLNNISYRGIYLNQNYDITENIQARHILKTVKISKTFSEASPNATLLGQTLLSSAETYDSTGIRSFDNTFDIHYNKKFNLGLAYTNRVQTIYYFKGYLYNLSGQVLNDNFATVNLQNLKLGFIHISGQANYHLTSRKAGDFDVYSQQFLKFSDSSYFEFNETLKKYTPDYYLEHYNGNYQSWDNSFKDIQFTSFNGKYINKKFHFEIGGDYRTYNNYIYFDSLINPVQLSETLTIMTAWIKKTFYLGPFVTDLNAYFQNSSNNRVTNIPTFVTSGSIYLDVPLAKGALILNLGVNASYTSSFYKYAYSPTLGVFYQPLRDLVVNYPIANVFVSGKIKSAIIIVRFDHADAMLLYPFYSNTEHYHLPYHYIRIGVKWWFKN